MIVSSIDVRGRYLSAASAACAGLVAGVAAIASPGQGLLVACLAMFAVAATRYSTGAFACALAAYLPFEGFVTSHLPASSLIWVRYAPEAVAAALAAGLLLSSLGRVWPLYGRFGLLVALTMLIWAASTIANGVSLSTFVLGVRAELRYLPLAILLAASAAPLRYTRMLATTIALSTLVQTALALAEVVGGVAVRHLFSQSYTVQLGGVTVTHATVQRVTSITGSLRTYNELAAYLVFGWVVMACAGSRLPLPRWLLLAGLVSTPLAVLATGSREGAVCLALAAAVVVRQRFAVPVFRIVAVAVVVAAVSLPWWAPAPASANHSASLVSRLATRWSVALQPQTWSGSYGSRNFRLYLARDELSSVVRHSPALGWGTGTIDDPRTLAAGTNPLLHTLAGRLAIASNFAFDGSWSLLLMQTGLLGLAAMLSLVGYVALVGGQLPAGTGWGRC